MDRWQYLIVLGACLLITAPLELFGRDVWWYNPRYIIGVFGPGDLPLEELLFFVVIPLCGLLTYSAVDSTLSVLRRRSTKVKHR